MNHKFALTCNVISHFSKYGNSYGKLVNFSRLSTKSNKNNQDKKEIKYDRHKKSFLLSEDPADIIIKNLKNDVKSDDVIVEVDPGVGILTKKILNDFDNKLLVFGAMKNLINELKQTHPEKFTNITIPDVNFHNFYKYFWEWSQHSYSDRHKKYTEVLQMHGSKSSNLKIVATIVYIKFFYSLLFDYAYRGTLFYGHLNPTFYLFVPFNIYASVLKLIRYQTAYRLGTVLSMYFDISLLGISSATGFHHAVRMKKIRMHAKNYSKFKDFFLLKFSPKDVNIIKEKTGDKLLQFHYFIGHLIRVKATSSLIDGVEAFIPNCGEEFIKNGFRMFVHPNLLTEDQWFKAFEIFKSHPDFESSIYLNEMSRTYRMGEETSYPEWYHNHEQQEDLIEDAEMHSFCEEMMPGMYDQYMTDHEVDVFY